MSRPGSRDRPISFAAIPDLGLRFFEPDLDRQAREKAASEETDEIMQRMIRRGLWSPPTEPKGTDR